MTITSPVEAVRMTMLRMSPSWRRTSWNVYPCSMQKVRVSLRMSFEGSGCR